MFGSFITNVSIPFHIAQITGSYVAVGIIGAIQLVPLVVFGLWGGAIADVFHRKKVVLLTEFALMLCTGILLINAMQDEPALWVIYVVAFLFSALDGIQRPSLEALLPQLVNTSQLPSASSLNSLRWNIGSIVGPTIGGFFAAQFGVTFNYGLDVISYMISILILMRLGYVHVIKEELKLNIAFVFSGFNYARKRPDLLGTYTIDIIAMIFAFPNALFPFIALEFDAPWALGLLYASMSVGALIATSTSGWTSHVNFRGKAIVIAATAWGIAIAASGLAPNIYFVFIALMFAGAADMISGLFRSLVWNTTVPLDMRGRLAGIEMLSYSLGPQLGQVRSTFVAEISGLRASLFTGGVMCALGASSIAVGLRQLWNFDDRTNEYAISERKARHEENF